MSFRSVRKGGPTKASPKDGLDLGALWQPDSTAIHNITPHTEPFRSRVFSDIAALILVMEPCGNLGTILTVANPLRMRNVNRIANHPVVGGIFSLLVAAAIVSMVLWILPSPHTRLHYLIAGTGGTAVCLGLLLAMIIRKWPAVRR
jgi:hypothetical protein